MLKNYVPSKWCKITEYQLVFDDRRHNGFGFPCDANGNLLQNEEDNPESYKNLHWCLEHPNEFERFNEVVKYTRNVRNDAHGTCHCGNEVHLYNQYHGACQCSECGQWYNLFGEELLPPEEWVEEEF